MKCSLEADDAGTLCPGGVGWWWCGSEVEVSEVGYGRPEAKTNSTGPAKPVCPTLEDDLETEISAIGRKCIHISESGARPGV